MKKIIYERKKIIKGILFLVMLYLFIILGTKNYQTEVADNIRFASEYKDISKNNIFKYVGDHVVLDVLNNKSAILFFGFPSNIWCHYYADYLNEIAMKNEIKEILYYNFKRDRSLQNTTYDNIREKLKEYLFVDDVGKVNLYAPTVVVVKNGKILYYDDEIASIKGTINPEDYFTDYRKNVIKANFDLAIKEYLKEEETGER